MKWLLLIALLVGGGVLVLSNESETIAGLDHSSFASLLVAATLLLFIGGSAIAGYGGRIGKAIKDIAIWALIAFALVTGYTYQSEFADIANRITSELMPPGDPVVLEPRQAGERSVRIRRRSDGHFAVRTHINDATVNMMVDTGASTVVLSASDARRIGLDLDRLHYSVPVQTANGMTYAAAVRLPAVSIGPLTMPAIEALVAKPGTLRESLLGMSFLRRLRSYEFSGDFLTMRG